MHWCNGYKSNIVIILNCLETFPFEQGLPYRVPENCCGNANCPDQKAHHSQDTLPPHLDVFDDYDFDDHDDHIMMLTKTVNNFGGDNNWTVLQRKQLSNKMVFLRRNHLSWRKLRIRLTPTRKPANEPSNYFNYENFFLQIWLITSFWFWLIDRLPSFMLLNNHRLLVGWLIYW